MPRIPTPPNVWTTSGTQAQMAPVAQQVVTSPTAQLKAFPGQEQINTANQTIWKYTGSQWLEITNNGGGAGAFTSLTVTPGNTSLTGALTTISGTNTTDIATDNAAGAVNIGTVGARTNIFGSVTGAAVTTIRSGTGAMTFTAGGIFDVNATGAVTVDTAAGISLDGAAASNLTVTGAFDLDVSSTAGSVNITGGEATTDAVLISASSATGGITLDAGVLPGVRITNGTQTAQIMVGTGDPNGTAGLRGSIFLNVAGVADTILWVNVNGGTTWTALTST